MLQEGIDETSLSNWVPHDLSLEMWLDVEDSVLVHTVQVRAGPQFVVCHDVRWRDFKTVVFDESLVFNVLDF